MRFPLDRNGKTKRVAEPGTEAFEQLVALLNYPMFVVTTEVGGTPAGCLVGFASQASIHPPRFLVGLSTKNHTFRVAANRRRRPARPNPATGPPQRAEDARTYR